VNVGNKVRINEEAPTFLGHARGQSVPKYATGIIVQITGPDDQYITVALDLGPTVIFLRTQLELA
jgi:hypothetical protein